MIFFFWIIYYIKLFSLLCYSLDIYLFCYHMIAVNYEHKSCHLSLCTSCVCCLLLFSSLFCTNLSLLLLSSSLRFVTILNGKQTYCRITTSNNKLRAIMIKINRVHTTAQTCHSTHQSIPNCSIKYFCLIF